MWAPLLSVTIAGSAFFKWLSSPQVRRATLAFSFADRYSPIPGDFTRSEVDRYMGLPAQAISYKVGERAWFEIRADIRSRRGAAFNLKDFHTQALHLGSLGLDQMRREMLSAM